MKTLRLTRPMASWRWTTIDMDCVAMAHDSARIDRRERIKARGSAMVFPVEPIPGWKGPGRFYLDGNGCMIYVG